jgi:putative transposase
LHLEHPFMGARMLRDQLTRQDLQVGRKHVGTLIVDDNQYRAIS